MGNYYIHINRKSIVLLYLIVALQFNSFSQNHWVRKAGGLTPDEATDISIDANGNTYTVGYFSGTASFANTSIISAGLLDVFLTKLNSNGVFQWVIQAGGTSTEKPLSIKTDNNGNSYITGYFNGTANFGSQVLTSAGIQDVFIAKYDNAGNFLWAKSAGGVNSDIGNGISIDNTGNVIVTGEFTGSANFGAFTLISLNNSVDVFITKLDANGNFLWAKKGAGRYIDRGLDVACDQADNIYITGQFTDTITFDLIHPNTMSNAIFLIKLNSAGVEQWFKVIGGGLYNIANSIYADLQGNTYLTGDFGGNLVFFGTTNFTLTNPYTNKIFIAKYNSSGALVWTHADGSNSDISSKSITIDNLGNPYVVGTFKCKLGEYAAVYGSGTFNSVGFWDIFVSKYTTTGNWDWSRQIAGKLNDVGYGIAVNSGGSIIVAGSFNQALYFPTPQNYLGYNTTTINSGLGYCNNPNYYNYQSLNSNGNSDILIAKCFDPTKPTFDYYIRNGTGCNLIYEGVCINGNQILNCPDSLTYCVYANLNAYSFTNQTGPSFNYLWSTNSTNTTIVANTSGYYYVTQTSADACFQSVDSIFVTITNPSSPPNLPAISDNVIINTNSTNPLPINLCKDSTLLTGSNFVTNYHFWVFNGDTIYSNPIMATASGNYNLYVVDTTGCQPISSYTTVSVTIDTLNIQIHPLISFIDDIDNDDTIHKCEGLPIQVYVYDSITNPFGNIGNCPTDSTFNWTVVDPNGSSTTILAGCLLNFSAVISGNYIFTANIIRHNACGWDTAIVSNSIYIDLIPAPIAIAHVSIIGNSILCPGGTNLLYVNGTPFTWYGGSFTGSTADSIYVNTPGLYYVISNVYITNAYGCSDSATANYFIQIVYPPQPVINYVNSNGIICPNDSIQLVCSNAVGTYQWFGPNGPIGGNSISVYVSSSGLYYCVVLDANGCSLVSNTLLINQYSTPYLAASSNAVLCQGGSVTISANALPGSQIQWQAPLSGNNPSQIVSNPGTYYCLITSCSIQTMASITVTLSNLIASITPSGSTSFCNGDSVLLVANSGGINSFLWQPNNLNQQSFYSTISQTYTLTVTDTNGCNASTTISTTMFAPILATIITTPTNCNNNTGTATVNATGGVGNLSYLWNNGSTTQTITQLSAGNYAVVITDSQGCQANTTTALPMVLPTTNLGPDITIFLGTSTTLTATNGSSYLWTPSVSLSCDICATTIATPSSTTTYTVIVTDSDGCRSSSSITIYVEIHCPTNDYFQVPNAFSPNNDGFNDEFCLRGWEYCVNYFYIYIYNRWGEKIFESNDPNFCWDGTYRGKPLDTEVFVYQITASLKNKEEIRRKGNISLIR